MSAPDKERRDAREGRTDEQLRECAENAADGTVMWMWPSEVLALLVRLESFREALERIVRLEGHPTVPNGAKGDFAVAIARLQLAGVARIALRTWNEGAS